MGRLARVTLRGSTTRIHELHQGIADRAFRAVGPAGRPVQVVHDAISDLSYSRRPAGARGRRARRRGRGVACGPAAATSTPAAPAGSRWPILNGAHGDLVAREAPGLALGHDRAGGRPGRPAGDRRPCAAAFPGAGGPARRLPARADRDRGLVGLRRRTAPRRPGGHLRQPAAARPRADAGVPALQHRPAHLRERPLARRAARRARRGVAGAGAGRRPHRALHGRAGRPQRAAPGRRRDAGRARLDPPRARHGHAGLAAPRRAAGARRPPARPRSWPGCPRPARSPGC